MIAVSITVTGRGPDRTVEATVADTVPVAELIPHLVNAEPGDLWRLSGPLGVLRPEHSLAESEVRPGERLTLQRAGLPAPPVDDVGRLSGDVPTSPAVWVAACLAAVVSWFLPAATLDQLPTLVWHPLEVSEPAQAVLDGVAGVPVAALLIWAVLLVAALAAAAASLTDARYVPVAALLGFGVGLQVSVVAACLLATLSVWRPGSERVVCVGLLIAAAVNIVPGATMLLGLTVLTFSGQVALGLAGVRLPRIPATGLFDALESTSDDRSPTGDAADRARTLHPALVVTCCVALLAGTVQLLPAGESDVSTWTIAALLVVALTGLSARACRPVHSVAVTVTATLMLTWVALHLPGAWSLLALLPAALPAIRVTSPLAGRVLDVTETIAFAVSIPLLIATTGVFELVRGIG
ncbi:MAG TPA: hypothetical protein H9870_08635 [Candidatus Corynebacterium avicola]|uniref:Uncharacterized protein n=1 Tax=Candidatus Corynebacterium avicola TaxID=2838527 RepID=A0A9D1UM84_9CORY|nr:hypothetical protein [Candidatus Corynebacterium avicola]